MAKRELSKKTGELKITVTSTKEEWESKQKSAKENIIKELKVDGFRKGKVPANLISKYVSEADVWHKALPKMLDVLVKEAAKEIKEEEMILDSPAYNIDKLTATELEVSFIYPIYPEIKLADYKNLKTKYVKPTLSKDAVQNEIENILKNHAMLKVVERNSKKGDTVKFDFEGFVDGEAFDGGKAENHELELGSGQFIPGFEEQLIGVKAKDEKEVEVTFPKEYHSKNLANKKATFKCKIHEVKEKITSELNDDLVKEINAPGVKTVEELKKYIKEVLTQQAEQKSRSDFKEEAFSEIKKSSELNISAQLIAKEMKNQEQKFIETMKKQGFDKKQYMDMTGMTEETMAKQFKDAAEKNMQDSLIFAEISKLEKIELTDADYDKEYEKVAKVYGQSVENVKQMVQKAQIQIPMTNDRVIDALIKYSK